MKTSVVVGGVFGGFMMLAAVNAVAILVRVPLPAAGIALRLEHHVFDAAETLGLGLALGLVAALVASWVTLRAPLWVLHGVAFVAAIALVNAVIGDYLRLHASHVRGGSLALPVVLNSFGLLGFSLAAAPSLGLYLSGLHAKLRWSPVVLAVLVLVGNQLVLPDNYAGVHGLIALGAALLAAPLLAPVVIDAIKAAWGHKKGGRLAVAGAVLFSVFGLVVPPPNEVRHELFRQPACIASWVLARVAWSLPELHAALPRPESPWFADRSHAPAVPPTAPLLPSNAVVVLITIDALRADVVLPPANDARFPTLAALKHDGVVFTHATTPGSQTPTSLATLFSGRCFSELRWEDYGVGGDRFPYPATDPSVRFPKLLGDRGVTTVNVAGYVFLSNPYGVVRGFREESLFGRTEAAASAPRLTAAILDHLGRAGDAPFFLYSHFAEPHGPYHIGPPGDDFHHYLSAVAVADAQVGRILAFLKEHFGERWVLIVSADHGEAFGDHQTTDHAKTLYEELVHVPLIVRSPLLTPRVVDTRVGLVDVGPTILDLFQVPTPAAFNAQSLVPILRGQPETFTRPLLSEGRLEVALTEPDGLKVIQDPRRKTVEVYDLAKDPRETRNVFDSDPQRADPAVAWLRAFYAARTLREGGYQPPYKP